LEETLLGPRIFCPSLDEKLIELDQQGEKKAGNEVRTHDIQLGKLTLYQLSYTRANKRWKDKMFSEFSSIRAIP
jgi:hypothetical protein